MFRAPFSHCVTPAATLAVVVPAPGHAVAGPAKPEQSIAPGNHESPFACIPAALTPAERRQHFEEYGPRLRKLCKGVRELPNGYEFSFAPDPGTYELLAAWMLQERRCCPFFDLGLRLDRDGGPLSLTLAGRPGVKEFIAAELRPWLSKGAAH